MFIFVFFLQKFLQDSWGIPKALINDFSYKIPAVHILTWNISKLLMGFLHFFISVYSYKIPVFSYGNSYQIFPEGILQKSYRVLWS